MRRAPITLVLLVGLAACASGAQGPAAPIAMEQFSASMAMDLVSARQTALDFLNAYAASPDDGGLALTQIVAGPKLASWVRWLAVQNAEFAGAITAEPVARSATFDGTLKLQGAIGARVELGASVTFSYTPAEGDPFDRNRVLDGPMGLLEVGPANWRVIDFTRDGVPMSQGIQLFRKVSRTKDGVRVSVDSLFAFTPNWQFNVTVENHGRAGALLDPNGAVLFTKRSGGYDRIDGVTTPSLRTVAAGSSAAGILAFPLQDDPKGKIVALVYRAGGRTIRFAFKLSAFVETSGAPAPTASVTPAASPS